MGAFDYKAQDRAGKIKKGVLEADTERQIRQQLREQGLIPLEIVETKAKEAKAASGFSLFKPKISAGDLALLTRQLATLVQSSLPIEEALYAVAEQCEKPRHKSMMMAVRSKVVEGFTLADGLAEFPHIFDHLFRSMVAAGEKSGHLDEVLNRLADYTEQRQKVKSQTMQAMLYPIIMVIVAIGIVSLLLVKVVPEIVGQLVSTGQTLPASTRILITSSEFLQNHGLLMLVISMVLGVGANRILKKPVYRLKFDAWILRLPVVGKISKGLNTARFARTLSILNASAVPLLEAMRISAEVLENQHIKERVAEAAAKVREGASLKASLENTKIFPPMMLHMIASGEKSGELGPMLGRAADNQDREFESLVTMGIKVLEPIMIVSMAGVVMFIVLAIIEPMLAMNSAIGR